MPVVGELADAGGEILADAGYRSELLLVELSDGLWPGGKCLGGRSIRTYLECVVASDFEEVGDLGQDL